MFTFNVPVENPTAPPNNRIAAPTIESNPNAIAIITIIGANPINVLTPCVVHINPKINVNIGMNKYSLLFVFLDTIPIKDCNAPLLVIMLKVAPEKGLL